MAQRAKRTFKYHITLRGGRGFAKIVRAPWGMGGSWPNRHITFTVAEKGLIQQIFLLFITIYGPRGGVG